MATPTRSASAPLPRRLIRVVAGIVLLVILPMGIAYVVAGADAGIATLMAVLAGVMGAIRSGWRRTANVVPLLGLYGVVAAVLGYGWGWVALMSFVGLVAGIGMPAGYLPALLYAGMVPTMVMASTGVGDALASGAFAVVGGALGVYMGKRMGAKAEVPSGKRNWAGYEAAAGGLCGALFVIGTSIAVASGMPHGYWIPLTLIVVIPPIVAGDDTRRGRERLIGTIAGIAIVVPLSLIPMPTWGSYLLGFALFVPALVTLKRSYTYYAFFESAAVVMLVSAGHDVIGTDVARVEASAVGVVLVAIAAACVGWGMRHMSADDLPEAAISP